MEGIGFIQNERRGLHHINSHPNIEADDDDEPQELDEGSDDEYDLDSEDDEDDDGFGP